MTTLRLEKGNALSERRISAAARDLIIALLLWCLTPLSHAQVRVLNDFSTIEPWRVIAAEGVKGAIALDPAGADRTPCLRLDFEFVTGGGYCIVQRDLPMDLPENYEFTFHCRASPGTPDNNLEFKLLDASGENVWWVNRRAQTFSPDWQRFVNKKRHIEFAWGPAGAGTPLRKLGKVELVIASSSGGKGSVFFDNLAFRELPPSKPYDGTPSASSQDSEVGHSASAAIDGDPATVWASAIRPGRLGPEIDIDFGTTREFGGLSIDWASDRRPDRFDVYTSDDGRSWTNSYRSIASAPGTNHVPIADAECRYVRIWLQPTPRRDQGAAIAEIRVHPPEFGTPNGMHAILAKSAPRGHLPRYFLGEQRFWTVVGDPQGGVQEALLSEDGALELGSRGPTVDPFLLADGLMRSWADATITRGLERGYLPLPCVKWSSSGIDLTIKASDHGDGWRAEYTVTNTRAEPAAGTLVLAVRPFQVNPPSQWLNTTGGVARLTGVKHDHGSAMLTLEPSGMRVFFDQPLSRFTAHTFDEGDAVAALSGQRINTAPDRVPLNDPSGLSSGLALFYYDLKPGQSQTVAFTAAGPGVAVAAPGPSAHAQAVERWSREIDRVTIDLPPSAQPLWDTARTVLGHILINRDGPAIQPGSRSYERSWARDGSMTSAALLEFGRADIVREWIEWFAANQFESGKVPCVVDRRGPDPVNEHDSHGQLILAIANYHRFTGDTAFTRRLWPNVQKAVAYIETIRAERMTPEFSPGTTAARQEPGKPPVPASAFFGLVPESISHEGYSAKPMHSYWDDFFVLQGLKDAAYLAGVVGDAAALERYTALTLDFRRTLIASIQAARAAHAIDYIPGCVELGDFDATSTTIALWPCGEQAHLPAAALMATFDRYWSNFEKRRDDPAFAWVDYTPYENRVIGSYIRLGQRDRALALIDFFMQGRRPAQGTSGGHAGWNQWPEVVYRDERAPKFLGDLPHTWCGSDFLNAFRAMFVYERETPAGEALVLFAGVPQRWLKEAGEKGIAVDGLVTHFGPVRCRAVLTGDSVRITLDGLTHQPPGGVWVANPFDESRPLTRMTNGQADIRANDR